VKWRIISSIAAVKEKSKYQYEQKKAIQI